MRRITTILRTCALTTVSLCFSFSPAAAQTQVDLKSQTKGVDFTNATSTKPFKTGTALPSTCAVGDSYFKADATAGQNLYSCTAANTWTLESGGGLPDYSGNADHLLGTNGSAASWIAMGGDVSGSPGSLQVKGLRGNAVASTMPTDGQVLRWNSSALDWEPGTVAASGALGSISGVTGGDVYGPLSSVTVTRLQNRPIGSISPIDGQVLTWSQAAGQWQPLSPATGTGGSGTGSASAGVSVLGVTYTSANTLTIGGGCSLASPCNVRFGNNVVAVTTSSTVSWLSGAGTAFIYVTSTGTVTVGSGLSLSCSSACVSVSGISTFPVNTIPIYTWNAVLTGWDASGGSDARAYLSNKLLSAGTGVFLVESGQQSTIGVDTTLIPTYTNGVASLSFGTLAGASCSADLSVSVPGAFPGDSIAPGWPATLPASVLGSMRVISANSVAVKLCNLGNASTIVATAAYRATIVRGL